MFIINKTKRPVKVLVINKWAMKESNFPVTLFRGAHETAMQIALILEAPVCYAQTLTRYKGAVFLIKL